ncbi:lactate utilization protein [Anaeromicropila populeti]|uniref:Uncharacterized ACR, YkgG family COG1556 n=1 Tax=Anaeromicropila populeti TaxID=37658 RepID=A0A1I6HPD1_9FIRM|nr:lactate utilization protein [Anaeromicropila populeti]SFR56309.1 Uncharacterised ACR, YkgG family COG1556 [Anaeromicropila populeti]
MSPKKQAYENLANSLIEKFKMRGFEGFYCNTREEACELVKSMFHKGDKISWGGSETLKEIGIFEKLQDADYVLYDRTKAVTPNEKAELYSKIVSVDYFMMSSNAITLDGQLVNIDGYGNRVACLCAGPRNVIVVAGMNKIVPDTDTGIARVRNMASPPNAVRLNKKTPCAVTGQCGDCLSEECLCCQVVITRKSNIKNRIKVILVGEELGY